jgi:DNA-binding HxlR family transcriptional regulator
MPDAFDIGNIDEVIHGRLRLGIMAYLADAEVADFNELKAALQCTQGNLSVHLRKLEDAGYIAVKKHFVARRPQTLYSLTLRGRRALLAYVAHLERLLPPRADEPAQ